MRSEFATEREEFWTTWAVAGLRYLAPGNGGLWGYHSRTTWLSEDGMTILLFNGIVFMADKGECDRFCRNPVDAHA